MYRKCPKCGYERNPTDVGADGVCPSCGLVFAKWVSRTLGATRLAREEETSEAETDRWGTRLLAMLTQVEPRTDRTLFWGRVGLYAVFVVWGCYFITLDFRSN